MRGFAILFIACAAHAKDPDVKALASLVTSQAKAIKSLEMQISKLSKMKKGSCFDSGGEDELYAFHAAERERQAAKKQEGLMTLFNVTVGEVLTSLAVSSGLVEKNIPKLVVAAGSSGTLYLYDTNGTLSLELPPDEECKQTSLCVVSAVVIGQKEDPFVAIGTAGGAVLLYNLTLPRKKIGNRAATTETKLSLSIRMEPQHDENGKPIAVTTLDTYSRGRKPMLAVGDASGAVRLLFRNGTQRSSLVAGSGPVTAMERGGNQNAWLAVSVEGAGVSTYDMAKPNAKPTHCEGSEPGGVGGSATIVAVAWDVQLTQLLYAATSDGVIAVYNTKSRSRMSGQGEHGNETKMVTHCKLVTTITGHEASPLELTPIQGYLLSASPSLLAVHNVSGLYARTRDEPNVMLGRRLAGVSAVVAGTRAGHVAVGSGVAGELVLLGLKLPNQKKDDEGGVMSSMLGSGSGSGGSGANLMRNPLVLGGVMVLVFWQSGKLFGGRNNGNGGSGGGRGGRGGGDDFGPKDFDMGMLKQAMDAAGAERQGGGRVGRGGSRAAPQSRFEELGGAD